TPQSVVEEARGLAEEALHLHPDLPEAHFALGMYHYWGRRDYDRAAAEFEIARAGVPAEATLALASVARRQGKLIEGIAYFREAARLDPRAPETVYELAFSLFLTRKYEEADGVLDHMLKIAPDYRSASVLKAILYQAWKGETDLAKAVRRE